MNENMQDSTPVLDEEQKVNEEPTTPEKEIEAQDLTEKEDISSTPSTPSPEENTETQEVEKEAEKEAEKPVKEKKPRKKLTKKQIIVISIIAAVAFLVIVASVVTPIAVIFSSPEKKFENMLSYMEASPKNATVVESDYTVKDGEVLVYEKKETITVEGEKASVTTVTSTLNSSYELEDEEKSSEISADKIKSPVTITEENISRYTVEKDGFRCFVAKENAESVFGQKINVAGDITIKMTFSKKKLTQIVCTFLLSSGKSASMTFVYTY